MDYRPDPRRARLTTVRRMLTAAALLWTSLFLWTYHSSDVSSELRAQLRASAPELARPRPELPAPEPALGRPRR
jgi:hypothetical protein